jgi:hypothetical protein
MAKYDALRAYLDGLPRAQKRVTMTFGKIEELLGQPLPPSAHAYEDWWQGSTRWSKVIRPRAWETGGWVVDGLDLWVKLVTFRRQD